MKRIENNKAVARRKGWLTVAGGVGTGLLFWKTTWILGLGGVAGTLYLAWGWFRWRAKHGLRF